MSQTHDDGGGGNRNVFVVGLDEFHLSQLRSLPDAERYRFHALFSSDEVRHGDRFPVATLIDEGPRRLRRFPGRIDAVIGYWDFPVSTTLPLIRRPFDLPGPSLEAVLQCEHKYWSRMRQAEVVPDHVPAFCKVDPFADDPYRQVTLDFPFWLKPVKSVLSHLGFRIDDRSAFDAAIAQIRRGIARYAKPFGQILRHAALPPDIGAVDGYHCVAENIISAGSQCTQEGFAYNGDVVVYGTVDSVRAGPTHSSFSRYQYPSSLPEDILTEMSAVTTEVIRHIGYDDGPFNVEYFWDPTEHRVWLLEINPRISRSHAPLFKLVDGRYHHQVMLDLGLGQRPRFPHRRGEAAVAAKFMVRRFRDARVTRAPTAEEIADVEAEVDSAMIQVPVRTGMLLSDLRDQDSYSFEIATVFVGGQDQAELEARFHACMERLPLELAPVPHR